MPAEDPIRGGHYGQRPGVPRSKAEHMAAPTNAASVKKTLANPEPSTHGPSRRTTLWRPAVAFGRVEMWRGGGRLNISVSASFVRRCLSGSTVTPFPHPAHRTGRADFPHPACMGLFLSRLVHAIVVPCFFILLFDPRREHSSAPTTCCHRRCAQRWSRTALLQRRRRLVLDHREHGGKLHVMGWFATR